ncbi:TPA: hypothetical protein O9M78_002511 [Staphylococcus aureus]|nr:hypothetical protein [Staphylococcus aureus]
MKRLLGLLLASTLVLVACGNDENKEESKKEVKSKEKKIEKEKENKSKKDKEKEVATQQQSDNQTVEQPQSQEQSVQQPQQQLPQNSVPQQNAQVQQNKKQKVDLNNMPPTDFSTEGMSEQAQKQIEELTMQKDYHGLSQREYNDRVSEIINNDN